MKFIKKIIGLFNYKLVEKNLIKNNRIVASLSNINLKKIIESYINKNSINHLIQIGANDGKRFDEINFFIKKYKINSLLVEPIDQYFNELKKNYADYDYVKFENSAISVENSVSYLFQVKKKYLNHYDDHVKGLASFEKRHLLKHGIRTFHIEKTRVETITLNNLIKKHNIKFLDLLFVDAEGYDGKIVYDFLLNTNFKPLIIFEYIHIENLFFGKLLIYLKKENYSYFSLNENLICFPNDKSIF